MKRNKDYIEFLDTRILYHEGKIEHLKWVRENVKLELKNKKNENNNE